MITINIANDFSTTPGARLKSESKYSGEEFRDKLLKPKFEYALKKDEKLLVNLDGGYGYATSFLEEAFGGLARYYKNDKNKINKILHIITFKSDDEPSLIEDIRDYIKKASI